MKSHGLLRFYSRWVFTVSASSSNPVEGLYCTLAITFAVILPLHKEYAIFLK